jgi:hypothetical protein
MFFPRRWSGGVAFDQLAILEPGHAAECGSGPFMLAEHKADSTFLLRRNCTTGNDLERQEPSLSLIRCDYFRNRTELPRFRRGELQLVDKLEPEAYQRLQ